MLDIPEAVKNLLKQDSVPKNFRITFPEGERADILNDQIIKESVQLTESLSTRNVIKFGSCDSSVLRFSCVGVEDITGMRIQARLDVNIMSLPADIVREIGQTAPDLPFVFYPVPYGEFVVDSCEYDAKMLTRKVIAYSDGMEFLTSSTSALPEIERARRNILRSSSSTVTLHTLNYAAIAGGGSFWDAVQDHAEYTSYAESYFLWEMHKGYDLPNDRRVVVTINATGGFRWVDDETLDTLPNASKITIVKARDGLTEDINGDIIATELYNAKSGARTFVRNACAQEDIPLYIMQEMLDFINNIGIKGSLASDNTSAHNAMDYNIEYERFVQKCYIAVPENITVHIRPSWAESRYDYAHTIYDVNNNDWPLVYEIDNAWMPEDYTISVKANKVKKGGTTKYNYAESFANLSVSSILLSACELMGRFGGVDRYGNFEFYKLTDLGDLLYPANDIYPNGSLYPITPNGININPEDYINAWHDEKPISFGRIVAYYRDANGDDVAYTQIVAENEEDYDPASLDYDLSNNAIITAGAYTSEQITTMCADLIDALRDLKYYRAEISMRGLPQVEAGDMMWVRTPNNRFVTPVLSRTLTGIQDLRDKIVSK